MRVLILSQYYWPENFRINEVATLLAEANAEVTVLTGVPNYPEGSFFQGYRNFRPFRETHEKIKIIRAPLISRGKSKGLRLIANYFSFAISATVFGLLFCRERYDAILVFEPSPITVGITSSILRALRKIPVLFWVQDLWPESLSATGTVKNRKILSLVERLVKWIYDRSDLILIQSRAFSSHIEKLGISREKIRYFPNLAERVYQPVKLQSDSSIAQSVLSKSPNGFRVMFAGNIGAAQDFGTILEAATLLKCHPEIQWLIVGDGRMRDWVEAEIKKRGLEAQFHLLGRHPVEKMPEFFACADAMLLTLKNEEIFSLTIPAKLQSYLACAKPVIASIGGEGARIIEEAQAGLCCPPESPEKLAKQVLNLSQVAPEKLHQMGIRGREYFDRHFDSRTLMESLQNWIYNLSRNRMPTQYPDSL